MPTRDDAIEIAVNGSRIDGTIVAPSTRLPGVLFVHGWGGSQEQYLARAREVAALGCVCLTFDLRGHAGTQRQHETVSRENNLHDVLAAYDVLARHPMVDPAAMAVIGSSYGGYLAAILSAMRPVRWLALRSPALYRDSGWNLPKRQLHRDQDLGAYRRQLVAPADNRALRACAAFRGDLLVVESEFDRVIPHAVITSYLEASVEHRSLTYRVIEGADHGLIAPACQRAYTVLLLNWMTEMLPGKRAPAASMPVVPAAPSAGELPEAPPELG